MVKAWYLNTDEVLKNQKNAGLTDKCVTLDQLRDIGVEYFHFDSENYENNHDYKQLRTSRGYTYNDLITITRKLLPNYDAKVKSFFEEHIHTDEEIRYILDGSGYFDVRDKKDRWIRIEIVKNDLLILPAGIYHRFTLDHKDYIKVQRLFVGEPVWTPHNRPADNMQERQKYVSQFGILAN
uniref:Acireductone dioxygenase n=1 Tax=Phallusia mammillata TaxID=59560 RepID=A0A6F9D6S1_9ASCI|nr:1,2-dihydroxy-3-keto-5-methylthiopentene dioxygenase [Phallusia mammillata]